MEKISQYRSFVILPTVSADNGPRLLISAEMCIRDSPKGYEVPEGRVKPWGTGHAILCAAEAIDGAPFAVINSDDYYGRTAVSYTHLRC